MEKWEYNLLVQSPNTECARCEAALNGRQPLLSHAKNLEDVVKIQTEFASKQLGSLNEQTKTIMEICTKAVQSTTNRSN
jgi:hypothetical protein